MSLLKPQYFSRDIPMTPSQRRAINREATKCWWRRPRNAVLAAAFVLVWMFLSRWLIDYVDEHITRHGAYARIAVEFGLLGVYLFTLVTVVLRYDYAPLVRRVARQRGHDICLHCGYWLRGLPDDIARCPECGARRETEPPGTPPQTATSHDRSP